MKYFIPLFLLLIAGCMSLDANLLDPGATITEYKMADYTGAVDFHLDPSYAIDPALVHVISLQSKGTGDATPTKIFATYIGDITRISTDTVIVYTHGYSHHMDYYYPRAQLLANVGGKNHYGVMMMDYRGFGLSEGKPSEEGLYADVDAALGWLASHGLRDPRLVMYGFSLGCAPATHLTANPRSMRPQKLLLESPFTSPETLTQDAMLLDVPGSFVSNLKLDNVAQIQHVQQPFFWVHGVNDAFINIETNGEVVYKNYHGVYREAHRIPGADHSTIPQTWGFKNYSDSILKFIQRPQP